MKDLPGAETGLRAGIRLPPSRRNVVFMDWRMYGCHPNERIFSHRFGLLSPRSAIAIARIVGGMAIDKRLAARAPGSIHLPGLLAGMATHATGMAHPRQTALATVAQSLSESVVESMASARSPDIHSDKTRHMSGEKAGADVYPVRGRRGATRGVAAGRRRIRP